MSTSQIELNILEIESDFLIKKEALRKEMNLLIAMRIYDLQLEMAGDTTPQPEFRSTPAAKYHSSAQYASATIPDNSEAGARERNQSIFN